MQLIKIIISFLGDKEYRNLLGITVFIISIGTVFYHYVENGLGLMLLIFRR